MKQPGARGTREAARGGRPVGDALPEPQARRPGAESGVPTHHLLSDREFQILTMMGRGLTVTQAATELSLSVKTVSTYRSRVLQKLGLATTTEMVRYAIRHHLTD
jgi:DNA-binding NarL/FixJ family response regulator